MGIKWKKLDRDTYLATDIPEVGAPAFRVRRHPRNWNGGEWIAEHQDAGGNWIPTHRSPGKLKREKAAVAAYFEERVDSCVAAPFGDGFSELERDNAARLIERLRERFGDYVPGPDAGEFERRLLAFRDDCNALGIPCGEEHGYRHDDPVAHWVPAGVSLRNVGFGPMAHLMCDAAVYAEPGELRFSFGRVGAAHCWVFRLDGKREEEPRETMLGSRELYDRAQASSLQIAGVTMREDS